MGAAFLTGFRLLAVRAVPSSASVGSMDGQGLNRETHINMRHCFARYHPLRPLLSPTAAVLALVCLLPCIHKSCCPFDACVVVLFICPSCRFSSIYLSIVRHIDTRRSQTTTLMHIYCLPHSRTSLEQDFTLLSGSPRRNSRIICFPLLLGGGYRSKGWFFSITFSGEKIQRRGILASESSGQS